VTDETFGPAVLPRSSVGRGRRPATTSCPWSCLAVQWWSGSHDHWAFHAQPLESWLATEKAAAGYDPALWFVGELCGASAAAMICCRYDHELYVQELATLPEFRRRGIGSALLAHAFGV